MRESMSLTSLKKYAALHEGSSHGRRDQILLQEQTNDDEQQKQQKQKQQKQQKEQKEQRFCRLSHTNNCVCAECSALDRSMHRILKTFGLDKVGEISAGALGTHLTELGYDLAPQELDHLVEVLDGARLGQINRGAFVASLIDWSAFEKTCTEQWGEYLRRAFDEIDLDRDGRIRFDELVASLQHKIPHQDVESAVEWALAEAGCRTETEMSFDDFTRFMKNERGDPLDNLDLYDERYTKLEEFLDKTIHGSNAATEEGTESGQRGHGKTFLQQLLHGEGPPGLAPVGEEDGDKEDITPTST
jgi:Ca2+-binding EF-hand superfamily protein